MTIGVDDVRLKCPRIVADHNFDRARRGVDSKRLIENILPSQRGGFDVRPLKPNDSRIQRVTARLHVRPIESHVVVIPFELPGAANARLCRVEIDRHPSPKPPALEWLILVRRLGLRRRRSIGQIVADGSIHRHR